MLTTGDGIFRLELVQVEDPPPAVDPSQAQPGTPHLAFAGVDVSKVFATMSTLGYRALSEPVEPASGPNAGGLLIYLLDPDETGWNWFSRQGGRNATGPMKRALSLLDSQDISAEEFDRKERPWQEERRHLMFCLACGKKATFRIVSSKRCPTFGARHDKACLLSARPWSAFKYLQ